MSSWVYDIESYPNFFSLAAINDDTGKGVIFEISERKNTAEKMIEWLRNLYVQKDVMVGFNVLGYDYQLLDWILNKAKQSKESGKKFEITPYEIYMKGDGIIKALFGEKGRGFIGKPLIPQIDLYKIHHFDNKAKATGLKMLEFNMRSDNIEDLPYSPGTFLTSDEMDVTLKYNAHDVRETRKFYHKSKDAIDFRTALSKKYKMDFTNHNDTKIGKDYFIMRLEKEMPGICYINAGGRRIPRQTPREVIDIGSILFGYVKFERPEFKAVHEWFKNKKITETKGVLTELPEHVLGDVAKYSEMRVCRKKVKGASGEDVDALCSQYPMGWLVEEELKTTEYVFDDNGEHVIESYTDSKGKEKTRKARRPKKSFWYCWKQADTLNVVVDGFRFDFGTGGIHGSIESSIVISDERGKIVDWDVASMYPNIAIKNRCYPEHLGEKFCDIYEDVYNERKSYAKGSAENAVMKLALNGVYGDSNNMYSVFYDPQYTMQITINGQLSLCMLAEQLLKIEGLSLVQCNTDGVTAKVPLDKLEEADSITKKWENITLLELEKNVYSKMVIRDVNNYLAVYEDNNKVKRKGAYEYSGLGWHQNQGGLVIPMAAEHALLGKGSVEEFITQHKDRYDFLMRTKVPRSSRLVIVTDDGIDVPQQNICRYYACKTGGKMVKIMPPLEGKNEERRIGVDAQWKVRTCNNVEKFEWNIDYDYYISEAYKLVNAVINVDSDEET